MTPIFFSIDRNPLALIDRPIALIIFLVVVAILLQQIPAIRRRRDRLLAKMRVRDSVP